MLLLSGLFGCIGLNLSRIPNQDLYADDGQRHEAAYPLHFAVVGDVRPAVPGERAKRAVTPDTTAAVVADISDAVNAGGNEAIRFVALLGDLVRTSSTWQWRSFSRDWSAVLAGTELPESGALRVRTVPVAGNHDRVYDNRLRGFGAAFQGVGADIGYGRVATWYSFDEEVLGYTWRFLVVDSDKEALGSRWNEQLRWLEQTTGEDTEYDALIVLMHHPLVTLATNMESNEGGGPRELLGLIEDHSRISALRMVFAGHSHTNEVFLPNGTLGELYLNAGGGGSPADSLRRWGPADAAGFKDVQLEPIFDLALIKEFGRWAETRAFPQNIIDKARGDGSYEGFTAEYDAGYFPIQGWWDIGLGKGDASLSFRMRGEDGELQDRYVIQYTLKDGWKSGR